MCLYNDVVLWSLYVQTLDSFSAEWLLFSVAIAFARQTTTPRPPAERQLGVWFTYFLSDSFFVAAAELQETGSLFEPVFSVVEA